MWWMSHVVFYPSLPVRSFPASFVTYYTDGGRTLDPGERNYSPHRGERGTRGAVGWRTPD